MLIISYHPIPDGRGRHDMHNFNHTHLFECSENGGYIFHDLILGYITLQYEIPYIWRDVCARTLITILSVIEKLGNDLNG